MSRKPLKNLEKGRVFVVSAPSGTGKTTLVKMLCDEFDAVVRSISCTTRKMRPGDVEGVDYYFISKEEFDEKEKTGEFLESATVYEDFYGTLKQTVTALQDKGKHVVLVIDTQGGEQVRKKINATLIFIAPPSLNELKRRLKDRNTDSVQSIDERLSWARKEIEKGKTYDYFIVNDDLNEAYEVLKSIIITEKHHHRRNNAD